MADGFDPARLARRDLRRLVSELWDDPRCDAVAPAVLDAAIGADAKSLDRTVLTAYLRAFPTEHPAFERLRAASALCATRRDWPWRARGERWELWDRDAGPARLATALLAEDDAAAVLHEAGLDGELGQGEFVADALEAACEQAADKTGAAAVESGERLIALFEQLAIGGVEAMLAWALLAPWLDHQPPDGYRDRLIKLLVTRVGDPRLQPARWEAIAAEMRDPEAGRLIGRLRQWLVRTTIEQFFKIVARTTDNPGQWSQRTTFWTSYLEHFMIDDAWFVLGPRAEELFRTFSEIDLPHGRIRSGDGGAGHSALVMAMGDLRIAEWSDNGSCRFWPRNHPDAPELGAPLYLRTKLKARDGTIGFAKKPHLPSPGWERRFARKIYEVTGRRHPEHGSGYA